MSDQPAPARGSGTRRVLVTGCAGYVGHQVALRLARAGWQVTGSSRRPIALAGVETVTGDHASAAFVRSLVERSDAVIHCAARTRGHDPAVFRRDNQEMTAAFAREARGLGRRLIYISSDQAVYRTGFYGESKRACEEIVRTECADWTIVRLTAVLGRYAPDMASTFSRIIQRLHRSSILVVPGDGELAIAPVWIGDVELVLQRLLDLPRPVNDVLEACGPVLTLNALLDAFERHLGVRCRRVSLPLRPLQAVARLLKPYGAFARLPLDALLDLGAPIRVSSTRLTEVTGVVPISAATAVPQIEGFPSRP